jgi:hypothetical protein
LELGLEVLDLHLDLSWSHCFQLLDLIDGELLDLLLKGDGLLLGHGDFLGFKRLSFSETFSLVDGRFRHYKSDLHLLFLVIEMVIERLLKLFVW